MSKRTILLTVVSTVLTLQSVSALDDQEHRLLQRLVLAEAQGEGELGMALVARSVLNRTALVESGQIAPGTYLGRGRSLRDMVYARNQYQPVSDGSLNRRRSQGDYAEAAAAIALARDTDALTARLRQEGLSDAEIARLLRATGFRTRSAFNDRSQNYDRQPFLNHVFNTDRFSRRLDVPALFAERYERDLGSPTEGVGMVGRLSDLSDPEAADPDAGVAASAPADADDEDLTLGERRRAARHGAARAAARREDTRRATAGSLAPADATATATPEPASRPSGLRPSQPRLRAIAAHTRNDGPLARGASGDAVSELQRLLRLPETGTFDAATEQELRERQERHGLPATGTVDEPTRAMLEAANLGPLAFHIHFHGDLHLGDRGPAVAELQRRLRIQPTGDFDAATRSRLQQWQRSRNINASGIVNGDVYEQLRLYAPDRRS